MKHRKIILIKTTWKTEKHWIFIIRHEFNTKKPTKLKPFESF
jgi:hypothetical protein